VTTAGPSGLFSSFGPGTSADVPGPTCSDGLRDRTQAALYAQSHGLV